MASGAHGRRVADPRRLLESLSSVLSEAKRLYSRVYSEYTSIASHPPSDVDGLISARKAVDRLFSRASSLAALSSTMKTLVCELVSNVKNLGESLHTLEEKLKEAIERLKSMRDRCARSVDDALKCMRIVEEIERLVESARDASGGSGWVDTASKTVAEAVALLSNIELLVGKVGNLREIVYSPLYAKISFDPVSSAWRMEEWLAVKPLPDNAGFAAGVEKALLRWLYSVNPLVSRIVSGGDPLEPCTSPKFTTLYDYLDLYAYCAAVAETLKALENVGLVLRDRERGFEARLLPGQGISDAIARVQDALSILSKGVEIAAREVDLVGNAAYTIAVEETLAGGVKIHAVLEGEPLWAHARSVWNRVNEMLKRVEEWGRRLREWETRGYDEIVEKYNEMIGSHGVSGLDEETAAIIMIADAEDENKVLEEIEELTEQIKCLERPYNRIASRIVQSNEGGKERTRASRAPTIL